VDTPFPIRSEKVGLQARGFFLASSEFPIGAITVEACDFGS